MKKNITYWLLIFLISFGLTIGIHFLLRPFWFEKNAELTNLTSFETLFTILLLPVILVTINYLLAKKFGQRRFLILNTIIVLICIYLSAKLHFFNWADSIGSRQHPDSETIEVIRFEHDLGSLATIIGFGIIWLKVYRKKLVPPR